MAGSLGRSGSLLGSLGRSGSLLTLTFSVPGAERVKVGLDRFHEGLRDFRPFWRDYAFPLLAERTQRNFETQGGFVGGWPPLSASYAAWKAKHYPGKPILRREDTLMNSLTWSGAPGPGGIATADESRAEWGTTVPYGIFHQRGGGHLPKRQVLAIPESETWGRLLQRFLVDQRKRAGLGRDVA